MFHWNLFFSSPQLELLKIGEWSGSNADAKQKNHLCWLTSVESWKIYLYQGKNISKAFSSSLAAHCQPLKQSNTWVLQGAKLPGPVPWATRWQLSFRAMACSCWTGAAKTLMRQELRSPWDVRDLLCTRDLWRCHRVFFCGDNGASPGSNWHPPMSSRSISLLIGVLHASGGLGRALQTGPRSWEMIFSPRLGVPGVQLFYLFSGCSMLERIIVNMLEARWCGLYELNHADHWGNTVIGSPWM